MRIEGVVVEGRRLGRELGFPTANVEIVSGDIESGVYLSRVEVGGVVYRGVTNVGTNPTVGEVARRSESYILDYMGGELYGEQITIYLVAKLREERRFESIEALRAQIARDVSMAREYGIN